MTLFLNDDKTCQEKSECLRSVVIVKGFIPIVKGKVGETTPGRRNMMSLYTQKANIK